MASAGGTTGWSAWVGAAARAWWLPLSTPVARTRRARYFFVIIFLLLRAFGMIGYLGKRLSEKQAQPAASDSARETTHSLSRLKRCKIRWENGATISDAMPIKASPENKAKQEANILAANE